MLKEEAFEILKSEWIVGLENGDIGNTFSDTYKLKDGAPEDIKKEFHRLCYLMEHYG